jgi:hypothetical protein
MAALGAAIIGPTARATSSGTLRDTLRDTLRETLCVCLAAVCARAGGQQVVSTISDTPGLLLFDTRSAKLERTLPTQAPVLSLDVGVLLLGPVVCQRLLPPFLV